MRGPKIFYAYRQYGAATARSDDVNAFDSQHNVWGWHRFVTMGQTVHGFEQVEQFSTVDDERSNQVVDVVIALQSPDGGVSGFQLAVPLRHFLFMNGVHFLVPLFP